MAAIDDYLSQLDQELRRRGIDDPRTLAEAREHLVDAVDEGRARGLSLEEAEREALERFGAPGVVAAHAVEEGRSMKAGLPAFAAVLWQRKWWVLVPTLLAAIVTAVTSRFVPDRYQAETRLVIIATETTLGLVTVTPRWANDYPELQRIKQMLWNRQVLERLIDELDLYKTERSHVPMDVLVQRVRDAIDVRVPAARVFSIRFVSDNPTIAMQVSERLAVYLIEENLRNRFAETDRTTSVIEAQLAEMRRRLIEHGTTAARMNDPSGGKLSRADELEYEFLQERYTALLARNEDAKVAASIERRQIGEQFRIIDAARVPDAPVGPNRVRIIGLGTLVGLALGLLAVVLRGTPNARPPRLAPA